MLRPQATQSEASPPVYETALQTSSVLSGRDSSTYGCALSVMLMFPVALSRQSHTPTIRAPGSLSSQVRICRGLCCKLRFWGTFSYRCFGSPPQLGTSAGLSVQAVSAAPRVALSIHAVQPCERGSPLQAAHGNQTSHQARISVPSN